MNEQELTQAPPASPPLATPSAQEIAPEILKLWHVFHDGEFPWREPFTAPPSYYKAQVDAADATILRALERVRNAVLEEVGR